jgi:hypothetical protein
MRREARTKSGHTIPVGVEKDASAEGGHSLKRQRGRERGKRTTEERTTEEVEEVERQPREGEGKSCLGKRRKTLRGAIVEASEL